MFLLGICLLVKTRPWSINLTLSHVKICWFWNEEFDFSNKGTLTYRYGFGAGVVGGKMYVAGGCNGAARLNTVEMYDPILNSWSLGPTMGDQRHSLGVGSLWDFYLKKEFRDFNFQAHYFLISVFSFLLEKSVLCVHVLSRITFYILGLKKLCVCLVSIFTLFISVFSLQSDESERSCNFCCCPDFYIIDIISRFCY